jgi:putative transposase
MPLKDAIIQETITAVIGTSRKGRMKVIHLVQKVKPELSSYRIRRVYERFGFSLFKRLKKRVIHNPSNPIAIPMTANEEWAIDFMSDVLSNDKKIRTLNVIDHYNRFCIGVTVRHNYPAIRVIETLERLIEKQGIPKRIRTDNGPEFTSHKFQKWLQKRKIQWSCIPPGRPDQNAIIERFNRTYREDILDANLLSSVAHAQRITDDWIKEYNHERPHQSLNFKTPASYAA